MDAGKGPQVASPPPCFPHGWNWHGSAVSGTPSVSREAPGTTPSDAPPHANPNASGRKGGGEWVMSGAVKTMGALVGGGGGVVLWTG